MKTLSVTIALVFCVLGSACAAVKPVTSTIADLDGNGRKEKIWVVTTKAPNNGPEHSVLHVGKTEAPIHAEHVYGFVIVDIDRSDPYKEIDVRTNSGGDGTDHMIYWYDGKSIRQVGVLYWSADYKGNGIVLGYAWNCYVGITEKYILDRKSRKLKLVPQEMYYVGAKHKVTQSFPVYYSRQSKSVVANVERSSMITVLIYVPNPEKHEVMQEWFLVKTQSGLVGWVRLQTLSQCVEGMGGAG